MFLTNPWFWAFLATLGWFLGLLVVGSKTFGSHPTFGVMCFILAQIPRAILPLPFVEQPRWTAEPWLLTLAGSVILAATLPFTAAVLRVVPWTRPDRTEPLRTNGFYSVVRHPLLFRDAFWPLGWSLIFGSVIGAALTPVWIAVCWTMAVLEEEKLVEEYGVNYVRYQHETPRMIPFLKLFKPKGSP